MTKIRVIYADTDKMGVVYYARYLEYCERARGDFLREKGISYREIEAKGYMLPVVEVYFRYYNPAFYDDELDVSVIPEELSRFRFVLSYRITRGEALIGEGKTVHLVIDKRGKATRLPKEIFDKIKGGYCGAKR